MSLEKYLQSNVQMTSVLNPTLIVAFVASWCPHSQNACKQLKSYDVVKEVYAVDLEAFVDPDNLDNIIKNNTEYKQLYNKYIYGNDSYGWKYPHIFMKDTKWHYIGGEDALSAIMIKKSYDLKL